MNRRFGRIVGCALATLLVAGVGRSALAQPCFMDSDESNPGSGVPVTWLDTGTKKIKYKTYIQEGKIPDKAKVLAAIKAAFQAYEDVECTTLQFEHAGEVAPADLSITNGVDDHILVFFGHDPTTWIFGKSAYFRFLKFGSVAKGEITLAVMGFNAMDWEWTADGAEPNKLDIQTAVAQLIPNVLGFHASADPVNGTVAAIAFNAEQRALTDDQKKGAQFMYWDGASDACKTTPKPAAPAVCAGAAPATDGGTTPTGDGGTTPTGDGGTTPTGDGGGTSPTSDSGGTTPTGDGGTVPTGDGGTVPTGDGGVVTPDDDDGCCRVSHARSTSLPFVDLLGLGLLLGLTRRRRK